MFVDMDSQIESKGCCDNLDLLVDSNPISIEEIETRSKAIVDLLSLLRVKDS